MKNQYQEILRSKIKSAVEQARAASVFTHQGVKGSVLEILIGGLFRPLLPSDIGVGTGQIIDAYNSPMSGQIDIILYDKSILPPVLIDDKTGIFPIESVLYTIEVKTTLNATELSNAHKSAEKISKFGYLPGIYNEVSGKEEHHPIERVRSVIFALGSDLTGTGLNEAERYKKIYADGSAYIRAICVAGKEYFYDDGEHWVGCQHRDGYDEVLAFIGGVTNTYKSVAKSRHTPLLGNYVVPELSNCINVESKKVIRVPIVCEVCGNEEQLKPNVGTMNITVNGCLLHSDPCLKCGGEMKSKFGTYVFVNGELQEITG